MIYVNLATGTTLHIEDLAFIAPPNDMVPLESLSRELLFEMLVGARNAIGSYEKILGESEEYLESAKLALHPDYKRFGYFPDAIANMARDLHKLKYGDPGVVPTKAKVDVFSKNSNLPEEYRLPKVSPLELFEQTIEQFNVEMAKSEGSKVEEHKQETWRDRSPLL